MGSLKFQINSGNTAKVLVIRFKPVLIFIIFLGILAGSNQGCSSKGPPIYQKQVTLQPTNEFDQTQQVTKDIAVVRVIKPRPETISQKLAEVIRLSQEGVTEDVLLVYVENMDLDVPVSPDEILYMKDLGIPDRVIAELIRKSRNVAASKETSESLTNAVVVSTLTNPELGTASNTVTVLEQPVQAPQPQKTDTVIMPAQVNIFYDTLLPYGAWYELDGYGWCWQPTITILNPDWRPYCHGGRWILTDLGWYWQSDYSWGWISFHYGRWLRHSRLGWVWFPDTVWAPAWVCWKTSPMYFGWAPLPPGARLGPYGWSYYGVAVGLDFDFGLRPYHYVFVPSVHFCDRYPHHHVLPGAQTTVVYNKTVVINNFTVAANGVVVPKGPSPNRPEMLDSKPEKIVRVAEIPSARAAGSGLQPDKLVHENGRAVIYRYPQVEHLAKTSTIDQNIRPLSIVSHNQKPLQPQNTKTLVDLSSVEKSAASRLNELPSRQVKSPMQQSTLSQISALTSERQSPNQDSMVNMVKPSQSSYIPSNTRQSSSKVDSSGYVISRTPFEPHAQTMPRQFDKVESRPSSRVMPVQSDRIEPNRAYIPVQVPRHENVSQASASQVRGITPQALVKPANNPALGQPGYDGTLMRQQSTPPQFNSQRIPPVQSIPSVIINPSSISTPVQPMQQRVVNPSSVQPVQRPVMPQQIISPVSIQKSLNVPQSMPAVRSTLNLDTAPRSAEPPAARQENIRRNPTDIRR